MPLIEDADADALDPPTNDALLGEEIERLRAHIERYPDDVEDIVKHRRYWLIELWTLRQEGVLRNTRGLPGNFWLSPDWSIEFPNVIVAARLSGSMHDEFLARGYTAEEALGHLRGELQKYREHELVPGSTENEYRLRDLARAAAKQHKLRLSKIDIDREIRNVLHSLGCDHVMVATHPEAPGVVRVSYTSRSWAPVSTEQAQAALDHIEVPSHTKIRVDDWHAPTADEVIAEMNRSVDKIIAETQLPEAAVLPDGHPRTPWGQLIDRSGPRRTALEDGKALHAAVLEGETPGGLNTGELPPLGASSPFDSRCFPKPADVVVKVDGVLVKGISVEEATINLPACSHPKRTELLWSVVCSDCGEKL